MSIHLERRGEAAVAMLTSPFISIQQARGPPKTQRTPSMTPFTRPFPEFCVKKHRPGLQQPYISSPDDTDWETEIDVIPRNEKPTQRVKRCLGDRENVSGRAFFSLTKNAYNVNAFRRFTLPPRIVTYWCPRIVFFTPFSCATVGGCGNVREGGGRVCSSFQWQSLSM